jgi:hemerythrin-like domain-containing protein
MTDMSPLIGGLVRIHKVISRGLYISIRKCDEILVKKRIPPGEAEGLSMYVETLKWVTHAHHLSEDEIVFPYFKDNIEAPYNKLQDDHNEMSYILEMLDQSLLEISPGSVGKLRQVLDKFDRLWVPHIKIEEQNFTSKTLEPVMGMNEQINLLEKIAEHNRRNSGNGQLTMPFMFYNLEGKDREEFMNNFPWIIRKVLVPVIWRGQWKPMSPYFL